MSGVGPVCIEEGRLVAVLDGELSGSDGRAVRAHLEGCPTCHDRLERLRSRDEAVRRWISGHDPEPPGRGSYDLGPRRASTRRPGRGWAAAAAIVLVSTGVLVSPARGLLGERLRGWIHALGFGEPVVTAPLEPAARPGPGPAATAFRPRGAELTLTFRSPETSGRLTLEPAPDSLVTLRTPSADVDLTVRRGSVEVDNVRSPGGDYRLLVPASLARIRLRIPGVAESVEAIDGLAVPRTVPLPGGEARERP